MLVSCQDSRVAYPCWYMLKQQLLAFEKATTNCKVTKVGKGVSAPIQHGYTDSLSRVDSDLPFFQTSGVQEAFERFDLQQVGFLPETFDHCIWTAYLWFRAERGQITGDSFRSLASDAERSCVPRLPGTHRDLSGFEAFGISYFTRWDLGLVGGTGAGRWLDGLIASWWWRICSWEACKLCANWCGPFISGMDMLDFI